MNRFMVAVVGFVSTTAFANSVCPNLDGSYACSAREESDSESLSRYELSNSGAVMLSGDYVVQSFKTEINKKGEIVAYLQRDSEKINRLAIATAEKYADMTFGYQCKDNAFVFTLSFESSPSKYQQYSFRAPNESEINSETKSDDLVIEASMPRGAADEGDTSSARATKKTICSRISIP